MYAPLSFVRSYLSGSAALIGGSMAARSINPTANGGYYAAPLRLPDNFDASKPLTVAMLVGTLQVGSSAGTFILHRLTTTHVEPNDDTTSSNDDVLFPAPNPWPLADLRRTVIKTFPGGSFAPGDWLGFQIQRLGGDASDTYPNGSLIGETLEIEFSTTS